MAITKIGQGLVKEARLGKLLRAAGALGAAGAAGVGGYQLGQKKGLGQGFDTGYRQGKFRGLYQGTRAGVTQGADFRETPAFKNSYMNPYTRKGYSSITTLNPEAIHSPQG